MVRSIVRRDVPAGAAAAFRDMPPVLARIYASRKVRSAGELDYRLDRLHPCAGFLGLDQAVDLLQRALQSRWRILVVGDFDADGATSSALVVRALGMMGAAEVGYLVPNRFEYGYGLTPEIVAVAAQRRPDLIVTVDNGISSLDGVQAARARGIRVLVTDHHLPGDRLPDADAIVNPNLPGDGFPSKHLAGVGVAFYLMAALRARQRKAGWFTRQDIVEPNLARLLDLVALGTVADVVPLDHNNRLLVAQGLARIRSGQCGAGVSALIRVAGRDRERISSSDLGYAVGPRLNAAGRLDDMSLGIECLLCDDEGRALDIARRLDELNRERQGVEAEMQAHALELLGRMQLGEDKDLPRGLCLFDPSWHQGIIGLLAARIKERFHRPVIAFAPANDGQLRGSARSIPGLHIRDLLEAIAARHPSLLNRFGGHAMAAGLSLERGSLEDFRRAFGQELDHSLRDEDLEAVILSDGELDATEIRLDLAEALRQAGPWGQSFPEPVFDGVFHMVSRRIVGDRHLKMTLRLAGTGRTVDAIAFNTLDTDWPREVSRVEVAYRLDVNDYQGVRSPQLVVEQVVPAVTGEG